MSVYGIQGQLLEVTVVGCNKLKDTEWISRQDPYVCLEYGSTKFRTRTCTDGGKNPTFQEKFVFTLIEGLRELSVSVWNSNTLSNDDFIGSGKVQLQKALSQGYDDSPWTLQSKRGRYSGEVRMIIHYSNCNKPNTNHPSSAPQYGTPPVPQYGTPSAPQAPFYSAPPPPQQPQSQAFYPPPSPYNPLNPPTSSAYQTPSSVYPPSPYPPQSSGYPPQPYPPPPQSQPYYPPGQYPGVYPPPPRY